VRVVVRLAAVVLPFATVGTAAGPSALVHEGVQAAERGLVVLGGCVGPATDADGRIVLGRAGVLLRLQVLTVGVQGVQQVDQGLDRLLDAGAAVSRVARCHEWADNWAQPAGHLSAN
jgi:uncharacterized protein related to proFAR isomerase